jgi:hypothetical protein
MEVQQQGWKMAAVVVVFEYKTCSDIAEGMNAKKCQQAPFSEV